MEIVKSPEDFGLSLKRLSKTIQNEAKVQNVKWLTTLV